MLPVKHEEWVPTRSWRDSSVFLSSFNHCVNKAPQSKSQISTFLLIRNEQNMLFNRKFKSRDCNMWHHKMKAMLNLNSKFQLELGL